MSDPLLPFLQDMRGQLLAMSSAVAALIALCPEKELFLDGLREICASQLRALGDQPESLPVRESLERWRDAAILRATKDGDDPLH